MKIILHDMHSIEKNPTAGMRDTDGQDTASGCAQNHHGPNFMLIPHHVPIDYAKVSWDFFSVLCMT